MIFSDLNGRAVTEWGFKEHFVKGGWTPLSMATKGMQTIRCSVRDGALEEVLYNSVDPAADKLKYILKTKDGREYKAMISQTIQMRIVAIAKKIEGKMGYPVDIEFGIQGGNIHVVQVRPVTPDALATGVLPAFASKDVMAKMPVAVNPGEAKSVCVVFGGDDSVGSAWRDIQRELGAASHFVLCVDGPLRPEKMFPYVSGEKLYWIGDSIQTLSHFAINLRHNPRRVAMAYPGDMRKLRRLLGPLKKLKVGEDTFYVTERTFDIYSNNDTAVMVKAGAVALAVAGEDRGKG